MKISIVEGRKRLSIALPSRLVFSSFSAVITGTVLRRSLKSDLPLEPHQLRALFASLRKCKQENPGLILVEVNTADGSHIKIKL